MDTIAAKRDGQSNTKQQLEELASGAASGSIPDYQLSAWLMAAYLNGLNPQETADLTLAMAQSGERLDLTGLPKPWLDKHSTGGVGDKTTLVVLPILAACGVTMVKMSGRGLGITGGTIDKLESIPGFRTDLTPEEMIDQAKRIGIALSGQTPRLAPADGALYALRDVTGTVASIPLITASILSKKIAGGADTVVLDVKCGSGAFMKTLPEAEALARSLVDTGKLCGLKVSAVITDMDQPLGMAVGNRLEVQEAVQVLKNMSEGPLFQDNSPTPRILPIHRFRSLCVELAGHALEVVGLGDRSAAESTLAEGKAFAKAQEWFAAQGADIDNLGHDDTWKVSVEYLGQSGIVSRIDALTVGEVVMSLGGGRRAKSDSIHHGVGVLCLKSVGDQIGHRESVFIVSARSKQEGELARERLLSAIQVDAADQKPNRVTGILRTFE